MSKIAVLVPCYNEEQTIGKVVADFKTALPEAAIYVYNNNSRDNTVAAATAAGAIVRNEYRQGKGNVMRTMFRDIEADVYLLVDGDDTYPADHASTMVNLVLEGKADMVIGDRLSSTYFTENKRPFHNTGNVLVRKFINLFWHRKGEAKILDVMTGYRAFSPLFVKSFPVLSQGFEIETEMTIHALDKNFLLRSVPIQYRDRPAGSTSKLNTYTDGFKVLLTIFRLYKNYRPLRFFTIAALVIALIATGMFVPVLLEYLHTGLVPRFPTLIVSGFLMLAALQCFSCGVILDTQVKHNRQSFELYLNELKRSCSR